MLLLKLATHPVRPDSRRPALRLFFAIQCGVSPHDDQNNSNPGLAEGPRAKYTAAIETAERSRQGSDTYEVAIDREADRLMQDGATG